MEIFYPMAISAVAVIITLIYASILDIRDRRVPFIVWLPMLGVGVACHRLFPLADNQRYQPCHGLCCHCRQFPVC